jgi:hypothetical protein
MTRLSDSESHKELKSAFIEVRNISLLLATVVLIVLSAAATQSNRTSEDALAELSAIREFVNSLNSKAGADVSRKTVRPIEESLDENVMVNVGRDELVAGADQTAPVVIDAHDVAALHLRRLWIFHYYDRQKKEFADFALPTLKDIPLNGVGLFEFLWNDLGDAIVPVPEDILYKGELWCGSENHVYRRTRANDRAGTTYDLVPEVESPGRIHFVLNVASPKPRRVDLSSCLTRSFKADWDSFRGDGQTSESCQQYVRAALRERTGLREEVSLGKFDDAFHALSETLNSDLLKHADINDLWNELKARASQPDIQVSLLGVKLSTGQLCVLGPLIILGLQILLNSSIEVLRDLVQERSGIELPAVIRVYFHDPLLLFGLGVLVTVLPPLSALTLFTYAAVPVKPSTVIASLPLILEGFSTGSVLGRFGMVLFTLVSVALCVRSCRLLFSIDSPPLGKSPPAPQDES